MSCWAWPVITNPTAAAAMFSKLSGRFTKLVCGISPPTTADEDRYKAGLRSLFLLSPSPEREPPTRSSSSSPSASVRMEPPEDDDDNGDEETAAATLPAEQSTEDGVEAAMASTLPCLAFPSEHGYMLFSLAEMRVLNGGGGGGGPPPVVPPVLGRRLVPSPYGGTVLAADVCYRHPCHLVDPFTGDRARCRTCRSRSRRGSRWTTTPPTTSRGTAAWPGVTDDGLAWDWSPRGVMVARGDTAFFLAHGGAAAVREWQPVHQAEHGSPMTVNYRARRFFLLELRSLETTVLDGATLRRRAKIPAPPAGLRGVEAAYLAPCDDGGAILLVRRAGGGGGGGAQQFTEAYRAQGGRGSPRWARARDVGDRAVFVDGAHAFTVAAGAGAAGAAALANHVYVVLANDGAARPGGRVDVAYDVGVADLARPVLMWRLRIDAGEVERVWGQPHWIIRRDDGRVDMHE